MVTAIYECGGLASIRPEPIVNERQKSALKIRFRSPTVRQRRTVRGRTRDESMALCRDCAVDPDQKTGELERGGRADGGLLRGAVVG